MSNYGETSYGPTPASNTDDTDAVMQDYQEDEPTTTPSQTPAADDQAQEPNTGKTTKKK
jgi:hypothetical protein